MPLKKNGRQNKAVPGLDKRSGGWQSLASSVMTSGSCGNLSVLVTSGSSGGSSSSNNPETKLKSSTDFSDNKRAVGLKTSDKKTGYGVVSQATRSISPSPRMLGSRDLTRRAEVPTASKIDCKKQVGGGALKKTPVKIIKSVDSPIKSIVANVNDEEIEDFADSKMFGEFSRRRSMIVKSSEKKAFLAGAAISFERGMLRQKPHQSLSVKVDDDVLHEKLSKKTSVGRAEDEKMNKSDPDLVDSQANNAESKFLAASSLEIQNSGGSSLKSNDTKKTVPISKSEIHHKGLPPARKKFEHELSQRLAAKHEVGNLSGPFVATKKPAIATEGGGVLTFKAGVETPVKISVPKDKLSSMKEKLSGLNFNPSNVAISFGGVPILNVLSTTEKFVEPNLNLAQSSDQTVYSSPEASSFIEDASLNLELPASTGHLLSTFSKPKGAFRRKPSFRVAAEASNSMDFFDSTKFAVAKSSNASKDDVERKCRKANLKDGGGNHALNAGITPFESILLNRKIDLHSNEEVGLDFETPINRKVSPMLSLKEVESRISSSETIKGFCCNDINLNQSESLVHTTTRSKKVLQREVLSSASTSFDDSDSLSCAILSLAPSSGDKSNSINSNNAEKTNRCENIISRCEFAADSMLKISMLFGETKKNKLLPSQKDIDNSEETFEKLLRNLSKLLEAKIEALHSPSDPKEFGTIFSKCIKSCRMIDDDNEKDVDWNRFYCSDDVDESSMDRALVGLISLGEISKSIIQDRVQNRIVSSSDKFGDSSKIRLEWDEDQLINMATNAIFCAGSPDTESQNVSVMPASKSKTTSL